MKVKVYAKLNLMLSVGARNGEFHPIDSVATSVDIYDVVEVTERNDNEITVSGMTHVATEQNSAYKVAKAFQTAFSTNGVSISVQKGIPFSAGMGGSSADAAAVVYCMCKLFGVDVHCKEVHDLCAKLGSDINFMLFGGLGRLQGKGDDITYSKMAKPLYFALTTFDVNMSSGEVYSTFDMLKESSPPSASQEGSDVRVALRQQHGALLLAKRGELDAKRTEGLLNLLQQGANCKATTLFSNDLQQATVSINKYADCYISFVHSQGIHCNMTGSGSAYYVACESREQAQRITDLLNANGFTTTVCETVPRGIVEIDK